MFLQQVHLPQYCPSVLALVIKYTIRMANVEANQFATCDCEISWLFSLAFTCQSLLIFESCIIIQNLLNQHLMMLFLHVVHTQ